jgi:hemerythrin
MGQYFEWRDEYCTGDSTVDEQHQYLFKLADSLGVTGASECKPIIIELYEYTRVHFKAEEEIMAEFKYPSLEDHKKLHKNLVSSLNDLSEQFNDSEKSRDDLAEIFGNWIINHILNEDLRFADFVSTLES